MRRRCRYKPATPEQFTADQVRRLLGLLTIVARPVVCCKDPVRRDDELLDQL
ncbi:hypothetical protein ACFV9C_42105 [Kribbella sp. NPDC059898]|uniref:hypothetical protein n=1 Tax=Kribbella sp. NPDC059898 TaxID=3346995 RepID=UPI003662B178